MIPTNPDIYHIWWGYNGGIDPSNYNKTRVNFEQTSWGKPIIFEVVQAWIYGDALSPSDSEVVLNWNQTPTFVIGPDNKSVCPIVPLTDHTPKTSSALLIVPWGNNWWINSQFSYKQNLSPSLSYIEFWLSKLRGGPFDVTSTTPANWEFHLIFQLS